MSFGRGIDSDARRGAVIERPTPGWRTASAAALRTFQRAFVVVPAGTPPPVDFRALATPAARDAHARLLVEPAGATGLAARRSLVGDARDLLAYVLRLALPEFGGASPRTPMTFHEGAAPPLSATSPATLVVHVGGTTEARDLLLDFRGASALWDGDLASLDGDGVVNLLVVRDEKVGPKATPAPVAHLVLAGGSDYGTFFAVSAFLQAHLGVRWLFPGEDGAVIPGAPRADGGAVNAFEEPAVRSRTLAAISSNAVHTLAELDEIRAWQLRNRLRPHNDLAKLFQVAYAGRVACMRPLRDDFTAAMLEVEERVPTDHTLHTLLSPFERAFTATRELRGEGPALASYPDLRWRSPASVPSPPPDLEAAGQYRSATPMTPLVHRELGSLGDDVTFAREADGPGGCPAQPTSDLRRTHLVPSGAPENLLANFRTALGGNFSHCADADGAPLETSRGRPLDRPLRFVPKAFATHLSGDRFTFPNWHPCIFEYEPTALGMALNARASLALDLATQVMVSAHGRRLRGRDLTHSVAFCDLDTWCQCDACVRADDDGGPGNDLTLYNGRLVARPSIALERESGLDAVAAGARLDAALDARTAWLRSGTGGMRGAGAVFQWERRGEDNPFAALTFDDLAAYGVVWSQGYPRTRSRRVLTLLNAVCVELEFVFDDAYAGRPLAGGKAPPSRQTLPPRQEAPVLGFHAYAQYMAPPMSPPRYLEMTERCHRYLMPYMTGIRDTVEYRPDAASPYESAALPASTEGSLGRLLAAPDQFNHERWSRVAQRTGLYEYITSAGYVGPHLYSARLSSAIRRGLRHHRLRGFICETTPNWCFDAPMLWELPRLLWNPGPLGVAEAAGHLRALRGDFCASAFGAAAGPMQGFIDLCEEAWAATRDGWKIYDPTAPEGSPYPDRRLRTGAASGLCGDGYGGRGAMITTLDGFFGAPSGGGARNRLLACWRLLNDAYARSAGDEPSRRRVQLLRRGFGLTLLIGLWYEPVQKAFEMIRRRRTDVYQMRRMTVVAGTVVRETSETRGSVSNVGSDPALPLPTGPTARQVTVLSGYTEGSVPRVDLMLAGEDRAIREAAANRIIPRPGVNGLRSLRNQVHRYLALSHADGASDAFPTLRDAAAEAGHLRDVGMGLFDGGSSTLADDAPFPNRPIAGPHRLVGLDLPYLTAYINWWNAIPRNGDMSQRTQATDERIQLLSDGGSNPGFGWCFLGVREAAGMVAVHGYAGMALQDVEQRRQLLNAIVRG